MKRLLNYILIITLLFTTACSFNKNDDNVIYLPGRKFKFNIVYSNADGTIRKIDPLELEVTNNFYPASKQTAITWTHYQTDDKDTSIVTESTGVVDSESEFFIHPPREGDLHILSFANFPTIHTSVFNDTIFKIKSTGTITMAKTFEGIIITKVSTTQEYQGKTEISLPIDQSLRAHHLKATASSELGIIYGNYYFTENLGFVKMDYHLPDKTRISIQLVETNF